MPEQAKVTSIEALEAFRTTLIIYREKAARILDEISDDVVRTRLWLETDRRLYWEKELRRRRKELEQRQAELLSARLSSLKEVTPMEHLAVREAKRAVVDAELKLSLVKQWSRQFDNRVAPRAKEVDKLRHVLDHDMRKAMAWLAQAIKTLDEYAGMPRPDASPAQNPPPAATPVHPGGELSKL